MRKNVLICIFLSRPMIYPSKKALFWIIIYPLKTLKVAIYRNGEPSPVPFHFKSRANFIASSSLSIFSGARLVIFSASNSFLIVMMVSRFITHFLGKPSSVPRCTSTGILRMVEVISATVTALRTE
jgi:hypothetical protein